MKHLFLKTLVIVIIILSMTKCTRVRPKDANGMGLLRIADDTLKLLNLDSSQGIVDYEVYSQNDTLFINILSMFTLFGEAPKEPIGAPRIYMPKNIKYVMLQDDTLYRVNRIHWAYGKKKAKLSPDNASDCNY